MLRLAKFFQVMPSCLAKAPLATMSLKTTPLSHVVLRSFSMLLAHACLRQLAQTAAHATKLLAELADKVRMDL